MQGTRRWRLCVAELRARRRICVRWCRRCGGHSFGHELTSVPRAGPYRAQSGFSTNFHKECKAFTASAQSRAGFLLKRIGARAQSVRHRARRSVCPARALRQSRRCPVILEGESLGGILQKGASAQIWLPGRCGLLTESSTNGRTGRRPPWCCRLICEACFADGDLPSASCQALFGAHAR